MVARHLNSFRNPRTCVWNDAALQLDIRTGHRVFLVSNSYPTALAWLCAGTSYQAGEVKLTVLPETAPTAALRFLCSQPLACVVSLRHVCYIYTLGIPYSTPSLTGEPPGR